MERMSLLTQTQKQELLNGLKLTKIDSKNQSKLSFIPSAREINCLPPPGHPCLPFNRTLTAGPIPLLSHDTISRAERKSQVRPCYVLVFEQLI